MEREQILTILYEMAPGDKNLIGRIGEKMVLPAELLKGEAGIFSDLSLLSEILCRPGYYSTILKLPVPDYGAIHLLSQDLPSIGLPLTVIFEPIMNNFSKAIQLCRLNEMRAREIISDRDKALSGLLRFRAAPDASPDAVFLIDQREMKFIDFNRAVEKITGYSRDELLKMGPGDIKPLFGREARQDLFESLIQGSGAQNTIETVHNIRTAADYPWK